MKDNYIKNLKKLIYKTTSDEVWKLIENGEVIAYAGIDPTGAGIHIGHLLWIHILINLIKLGNRIIILIGGFTGNVGDPTDKTQTRVKLDEDIVSDNAHGLLNDVQRIFSAYKDNVMYVNNNNWLKNMTISEYMDYGYFISVNRKINMETFKNRIDSKNSLTMTEFLYPDLQCIDFCHLNSKYKCNVQVGGADQWGNIAFGVHYTNQINSTETFGIVSYLLTDTSGSKFSKSTGAFHVRDFEKAYHGYMNLSDSMANEIAEMFNVVMDKDNPQNTKKNLAKYTISLFDYENYESIYDKIEKKALILFKAKNAENIPEEYFVYLDNNLLSKVLINLFSLNEFEAQFAIQDKSIKIDGVIVNTDINIPLRCKISYGKKHHAFVKVI